MVAGGFAPVQSAATVGDLIEKSLEIVAELPGRMKGATFEMLKREIGKSPLASRRLSRCATSSPPHADLEQGADPKRDTQSPTVSATRFDARTAAIQSDCLPLGTSLRQNCRPRVPRRELVSIGTRLAGG